MALAFLLNSPHKPGIELGLSKIIRYIHIVLKMQKTTIPHGAITQLRITHRAMTVLNTQRLNLGALMTSHLVFLHIWMAFRGIFDNFCSILVFCLSPRLFAEPQRCSVGPGWGTVIWIGIRLACGTYNGDELNFTGFGQKLVAKHLSTPGRFPYSRPRPLLSKLLSNLPFAVYVII
jgi:hypothetical protein